VFARKAASRSNVEGSPFNDPGAAAALLDALDLLGQHREWLLRELPGMVKLVADSQPEPEATEGTLLARLNGVATDVQAVHALRMLVAICSGRQSRVEPERRIVGSDRMFPKDTLRARTDALAALGPQDVRPAIRWMATVSVAAEMAVGRAMVVAAREGISAAELADLAGVRASDVERFLEGFREARERLLEEGGPDGGDPVADALTGPPEQG
jgi:hypothetical protein